MLFTSSLATFEMDCNNRNGKGLLEFKWSQLINFSSVKCYYGNSAAATAFDVWACQVVKLFRLTYMPIYNGIIAFEVLHVPF